MSRIGQQPVDIPEGVTVTATGSCVSVKGKQGELSQDVPGAISVAVADGKVMVTRGDETRESRSYHGLVRSLIANMVEGVSKGFSKDLEIQGVGFRGAVQGKTLSLSLGFASPIAYPIPEGITITEAGGTKITIAGADKQKVGDVAARIRGFFPAEPYKGKGIRYVGEQVRRKVGKTVA